MTLTGDAAGGSAVLLSIGADGSLRDYDGRTVGEAELADAIRRSLPTGDITVRVALLEVGGDALAWNAWMDRVKAIGRAMAAARPGPRWRLVAAHRDW